MPPRPKAGRMFSSSRPASPANGSLPARPSTTTSQPAPSAAGVCFGSALGNSGCGACKVQAPVKAADSRIAASASTAGAVAVAGKGRAAGACVATGAAVGAAGCAVAAGRLVASAAADGVRPGCSAGAGAGAAGSAALGLEGTGAAPGHQTCTPISLSMARWRASRFRPGRFGGPGWASVRLTALSLAWVPLLAPQAWSWSWSWPVSFTAAGS